MQIGKTRSKSVQTGFTETKKFEVEVNGVFMHMLYGGLYKDPMAAVIRELSTNAFDSHIVAGKKETKFDVHLPNMTEPYFYVRDYGTGLSYDEMYNLYTVFGKSTKRETNDQAGCLGLGSKTPLAYADSFVAESYYNGKKYLFSIYKDDEGMPTLGAVDKDGVDTDEPNGLKVQMSVKPTDFRNFKTKAETIYEYFPVKPNILGCRDFYERNVEYVFQGDNWQVRKASTGYEQRGARVVMGPVYYPISDLDDTSLTSEERQVLQSNIDLFVEIGDVAINPSREGLNFNKRTIKNICRRISEVCKDFGEKVSNHFDSAKNLWEARCNFQSIRDTFPNQMLGLIDYKKTLYKGQRVSEQYGRSWYGNPVADIKSLKQGDVEIRQYSKDNWSQKAHESMNSTIYASSDTLFVEMNEDKGYDKCKYYCETEKKPVVLLKFNAKGSKDKVMEFLGIDDSYFKKVSDLPSRPRVATNSNKPAKPKTKSAKVCTYNAGNYRKDSSHWSSDLDKDMDEGGVYINLYRYTPKYDGKDLEFSTINRVLHALNEIGECPKEVYGARNAVATRVEKSKKWIHLFDYAKDKLSSEFAKFNHKQIEHNKSVCDKIHATIPFKYAYFEEIAKLLKDGNFKEVADEYIVLKKSFADNKLLEKAKSFGETYRLLYNKEANKTIINHDHLIKKVKDWDKRYLLLNKVVGYGLYGSNKDEILQHLADYISTIDSKKGN